MTLDEQTEKRVYEKLRAFDGLEVAGHAPVDSSIASVLSEGEVLADVSDGFVFVGPGTYYENVVIDKDDFTLQGAGHDTLIDGGTVDSAVTTYSDNTNIQSVSVSTTQGASGNHNAIEGHNVARLTVNSVVVRDTDRLGVLFQDSTDTIITNCLFENGALGSVYDGGSTTSERAIITNNTDLTKTDSDMFNINGGDDYIVANNYVEGDGTGTQAGMKIGNDAVVIGNRVHNVGGNGIETRGSDAIIANNRISDCGTNIFDGGTGTVTDGNLTGTAN
jgi:hypothetical protein